MNVLRTELPGVFILEPERFSDARGTFFEAYNRLTFNAAVGSEIIFVQDNQSTSRQHVLRGLHYQVQKPQGKLVRAVVGEIFDVVVDLRGDAPTFRKWIGVTLSEANGVSIWIPPQFAHGFLTISERAICAYKTTEYYSPQHERTIRWDDPALGIAWPVTTPPILSAKDANGLRLEQADFF
jgi:dTDP-4-dehydrorhamnose 3,5-epimerase